MIMRREQPNEDELLADINRQLEEETRLRNLTPDPEMGGLNPEQVSQLIYLS